MGLKFWSQMPVGAATAEKIIMIGNPATPDLPERTTLQSIKTYVNSGTRSVTNLFDPRGLITPSTNVAITSRDLFDEAGIGTNGVIEADITNTSTNIVLNGLPSVIEAENNHFIGATVKTLETSSVTLQVIDGDNPANILGSTEIESTSEYKDVIIPIKPTVSINNPYIKILIDSSESVNNISIKDIIAVKTDEFLGYSTPVIDKKTIDLTTKSIADTATLNEVSLKVNNKTRIELNELPDGTRTLFTASKIFLAGTADVYANRLKQYKGTGIGFDYIEASANKIEFAVAPETGVVLVLEAVENTNNENIVFADSVVKDICATNWGSGGEITYAQASIVTNLGSIFSENTNIISFNELQYFSSLKSIGESTFDSCTSLNSIIIPNSVTEISTYAFNTCTSLTSITIPSSVTSIGYGAFQYCTSLISIVIPNTIALLADNLFYGCTSLISIVIPNSITTIGYQTFINCIGLTSITIPSSVTAIGEIAFQDCINLATVTIEAITPPTLGVNVFLNDTNLTHIYVPSSSVSAYQAATNWSVYASIISGIGEKL